MTDYQWTDGSGRLVLDLAASHVDFIPRSGPADDAVALLRRDIHLRPQLAALDAAQVRACLQEYGAWDDAELADHDANLSRLLWIACGDVAEQPDLYEVTE